MIRYISDKILPIISAIIIISTFWLLIIDNINLQLKIKILEKENTNLETRIMKLQNKNINKN